MIPPEIAPVLRLLPAAPTAVERLGGPGRPWAIRYGSSRAVLRWNDPARSRHFGQSAEVALASITWLHGFLSDLAATGYVAPRPVADLDGRSLAVVDGAIWELLAHVPGKPMGWTDGEIHRAGAALARFHDVSSALRVRSQRPGSLGLEDSRPAHPDARAVRADVEREMVTSGFGRARGIIHGDATQSNIVIGDDGVFHLVDFALAYDELLYFDIGSALWRNGRSAPDAVTYDAARVARFVRGYRSIRPLDPGAASWIVSCMKGRGLQLQHRLELRRGTDETVMRRLLSIQAAHAELAAAIESVLE